MDAPRSVIVIKHFNVLHLVYRKAYIKFDQRRSTTTVPSTTQKTATENPFSTQPSILDWSIYVYKRQAPAYETNMFNIMHYAMI